MSDPIQELNLKVSRTKYLDHDTLQANSIYAYNATDDKLRGLRINDNNELLVTSGSSGPQSTVMKGLTDVSDPNTEQNVRVNSIGEMAVTAHMKGVFGNVEKDVKTTSNGELITKNLNELLDNGKAQVFLSSAGGTAVKADSSCSITADPEYREGWNCVNSTASTKFNLYIFNGAEEIMTLGDLASIYFKGYINRYTGIQSMPFLQVYTKPTGSGDAGPFFHSRINWVYSADDTIGLGEECVFWGEGEPSSQFSNRKIQLSSKLVLGDGADSEEILYIVCASDSSANQNEMNSTINLIGFNDTNIKRNYHLVGRDITNLWESDISNNIKGDIDSINTSAALIDAKISKGSDALTAPAGLQQVLIYGKEEGTGDLDPIDVDAQGRLITVSYLPEPVLTPYTSFINNGTIAGRGQSTQTINMNGFRNVQIVGQTGGANDELGFAFYDGVSAWRSDGVAAGLFNDGINNHFSMILRDVGAASLKIENLTNQAINNLFVSVYRY